MQGKVSVVIPANNEAKTVGNIVRECKKCCHDVIVIDDGSVDETGAVAQQAGALVLRNMSRLGIVGSIARGMNVAEGEVVVTIDADGQHDPSEIRIVARPILEGHADLVLGRRRYGLPLSERVITKLVNRRVHCVDVGTGFRAVKGSISAQMRLWGVCLCGSFVLEAYKCGARVTEVPITIQDRKYGRSHWSSPLSRGFTHTRQLAMIIARMNDFPSQSISQI